LTGLAVVVGEETTDPLIPALVAALRRRACEVQVSTPGSLALAPLTADSERATWSGREITAAVLRSPPDRSLAEGIEEGDRSFATSEVLAVWLHLLSLPSVRSLNRTDPEAWFAIGDWTVWRRRLAAAGLPLAPLVVGDCEPAAPTASRWAHWGGGDAAGPVGAVVRRTFVAAVVATSALHRSLWCCGRVIEGRRSSAVEGAGRVLAGHGITLAGIDTDDEGAVVGATSRVAVSPAAAGPAAEALAEHLAA
jgi:hypothetical protein